MSGNSYSPLSSQLQKSAKTFSAIYHETLDAFLAPSDGNNVILEIHDNVAAPILFVSEDHPDFFSGRRRSVDAHPKDIVSIYPADAQLLSLPDTNISDLAICDVAHIVSQEAVYAEGHNNIDVKQAQVTAEILISQTVYGDDLGPDGGYVARSLAFQASQMGMVARNGDALIEFFWNTPEIRPIYMAAVDALEAPDLEPLVTRDEIRQATLDVLWNRDR